MEDKHIWRFSANGQYSAKTAYEGFFLGATVFRPWEKIWKTWAPAKCSFFMWLVAHNKCWTADRLAKRGLPHPDRCPMCDQESETINHLLIGCSFARELWHLFLSQVGLQALSPQLSDSSFRTGGRGSPLTVVFLCFKESTLLSFLGLGLYGLNETIVSLTEPPLMWLGLLFCPAKKESYGRWRGLEEFPSLLPLH